MSGVYVRSSGPPDAKVMFIGEMPGRYEASKGEPFCGPAGDNAKECAQVAGLEWRKLYKTNIIKHYGKPIEAYFKYISGKNARYEFREETDSAIRVLEQEISEVRPNVIVAVGNIPLWVLCNRTGINKWRGSVLESTLIPGQKVIPIIQPATWTQEKLYENPGAYLNRYLVAHDLRRVKREMEFPEIVPQDYNLIIKPAYYQAMDYLETCYKEGLNGSTIDYDIETLPGNMEISCIGIGHKPEESMCIALVGANGDIYTPEQELDIILMTARISNEPRITKRGQNVIFDSHYFLRYYGIRTKNLECTMIAQGIAMPEFPKGLDFIDSIWTDIPYYKQEGKIWLGSDVGMTNPWERGWLYNCTDVVSTGIAHPKQMTELKDMGNIDAYNRQKRLIEPLTYMMERGIRVDLEGMKQAAEQNRIEAEELLERINQTTGTELNINSPKQLCDYFYVTLKYPPYLSEDSKQPTVNKEALTRLANKGATVASLILKYRALEKSRSTFLDTSQVDSDGRMRCSYNPVGTKYGRISSSESIYGTGTNMQNQPHYVLRHFLADDGYVYYSIDMSEIENRIVAYAGNIIPMIEAFEAGLDMHRVTAARVLQTLGVNRRYEDVTPDERQDMGKRPNHAFNYGFGYKSFSIKYEVPEREAKLVHRGYHKAYPQLETGYWKRVSTQLERHGAVFTLFGRKIPFLGMRSTSLMNQAYSACPQGTCGELVNEHGICFTYYNESEDFRTVELLTQVHDSLGIQIPLSTPLAVHARVLIAIKESLQYEFDIEGRRFRVPTDLVVGKNLCKDDGVEIKAKDFSSDPKVLEKKLAEALGKLELMEAA